ncbi:3332_t:CDS:2, partial [Entrophospora sp. SA101]
EDEVVKCQVTVKQGDKEIMRGKELEFFQIMSGMLYHLNAEYSIDNVFRDDTCACSKGLLESGELKKAHCRNSAWHPQSPALNHNV